MEKEARFYEKLEDLTVRCTLCPHKCTIADGKKGFCRVRKNKSGTLYSEIYGEISSVGIDPIEKKPLFHFYPGSKIFSIGTIGCNLKCEFCQNWQISQVDAPTDFYTSQEVIEAALYHNSIGIAFTYNEPFIWYEYVYDTALLAKKNNLKNVLVTNGYVNFEPLNEIIPLIDAMNIDLKAFNDEFYKKVCGGDYETVLRNIEISYKSGVYVEVTTLIVTGGNDDLNELENEFSTLSEISPDIPLHLSKYHPAFKYKAPSTDIEFLKEAYKIAKKYLNYVYVGNILDERYETTYCSKCGNPAIIRKGFDVDTKNIDSEGRCKVCKNQIQGRFQF